MNQRKGLVMREIRLDEMAQSIDLLNYVFQMSMSIHKDRRFVNAKSKQFNEGHAIGWFDGSHLVSQILSLPFEVNVHGRIYEMGGITAVGTYPEYSRHGLMESLIIESLERMRNEGLCISYLFPYSIPYYRKKGWEIMSDIVEFQIKDTQLPHYKGLNGKIRRVDPKHEDVVAIYASYAKKTHGVMVRNSIAWNEKFQEDFWEEKFIDSDVNLQAAVYYDEDDMPQGYMFYRIMEENYYIDEIVYLQEEARKGLWNFVSAHSSMIYNVYGKTTGNEAVAFLLEDSEIIQKVSPYFMARIVDVKEFLLRYPFTGNDFQLRLAVTDRIVAWNNGTFVITKQNGKVTVEKVSETQSENAIQLTVQTLATMLLGYKRPSYLEKIERLQGNAIEIALLETVLPIGIPTFIDYF
ncbi:GNAT family N-acetyltransferase [Lysinibacillus xylanilyticus]|uniref:GNAT family N-acetyltransferase n=1 Tax=Lysinibacillus xylanilyticus TaxID=582475 RepID=A0A2M9QBW9_9BACI|nr:GNAT family N-acetyltransferase [Lysinibacillus xylanilyticus]PJO45564.1 GNAT family N-acetyltransferase [Lysinibacillus xylanilyticus]